MENEVPEQRENSAIRGIAPENPLVLIPVTAEDAARGRRRTRLAIGTVVLAVALAAGYLYKRSVDPIHAQQAYDSGVRLFTVARYPEAILAFDRAISLNPAFTDAYLMRGRANAADARVDAAISDFTRTLALRPNDTQAMLSRGLKFLDLKDYQSAIADADRALAVDSRFAPAYNLRGRVTRALGDPRKSLKDFTHAIELAPLTDNLYQRAATYQMLGEHERAIEDLNRMLALQPDSSAAYFARAESRMALGDTNGAEADRVQARILESH